MRDLIYILVMVVGATFIGTACSLSKPREGETVFRSGQSFETVLYGLEHTCTVSKHQVSCVLNGR